MGLKVGDVNLYGYVHNNPVNYTDSTGLEYDQKTKDKVKKTYDKYKAICKECETDMSDIGNCTKCCKKISQSLPWFGSDASGWWVFNQQCVAIICVPQSGL